MYLVTYSRKLSNLKIGTKINEVWFKVDPN